MSDNAGYIEAFILKKVHFRDVSIVVTHDKQGLEDSGSMLSLAMLETHHAGLYRYI